MADITAAVNKIKTAVIGQDVRQGIADAMEAVNTDAIKISGDYTQVITAAGQVGAAVTTTTANAATATTKAAEAQASATAAANSASTAAANSHTHANKAILDGISGTNTGDETAATIKAKLGITTLSGSNTGDQVIPTTLPASDVYAWAKAATKPTYTKSEVGLGNVDNTTDANKPISTATQAALSALEFAKYSSYATNMDANGIYVNVEWKRANATTYAKSTLIGTTPMYSQVKMDYYDTAGTTIINTITWNLTYDGNGFLYQKVVV